MLEIKYIAGIIGAGIGGLFLYKKTANKSNVDSQQSDTPILTNGSAILTGASPVSYGYSGASTSSGSAADNTGAAILAALTAKSSQSSDTGNTLSTMQNMNDSNNSLALSQAQIMAAMNQSNNNVQVHALDTSLAINQDNNLTYQNANDTYSLSSIIGNLSNLAGFSGKISHSADGTTSLDFNSQQAATPTIATPAPVVDNRPTRNPYNDFVAIAGYAPSPEALATFTQASIASGYRII